jgi:uncharacterized protein
MTRTTASSEDEYDEMIIEVSKVSPEGSRYEGEEPAAILDLDQNPLIKPEGPISYDFFVQRVAHEILVTGSLRVKLSMECSRCADFFSTILTDSSFLRAYEVPEGTETVDIKEDIREDILLNLSTFPLCSETCRGLCPQCGKNLNEGLCACKPATGKSGNWSALDKLKLE